jgi:hypothetical protein
MLGPRQVNGNPGIPAELASDFYRFPGLPGKVLDHAQTKARASGQPCREKEAAIHAPKLREPSLSRYPHIAMKSRIVWLSGSRERFAQRPSQRSAARHRVPGL